MDIRTDWRTIGEAVAAAQRAAYEIGVLGHLADCGELGWEGWQRIYRHAAVLRKASEYLQERAREAMSDSR